MTEGMKQAFITATVVSSPQNRAKTWIDKGKIERLHAEVVRAVDGLDSKVVHMLTKQENEYMVAFRSYVASKEEELQQLKTELKEQKASEMASSSLEAKRLAAQLNGKRKETEYLHELCDLWTRETTKWKSKALHLADDISFWEKKAKAATKEAKILRYFLAQLQQLLSEQLGTAPTTDLDLDLDSKPGSQDLPLRHMLSKVVAGIHRLNQLADLDSLSEELQDIAEGLGPRAESQGPQKDSRRLALHLKPNPRAKSIVPTLLTPASQFTQQSEDPNCPKCHDVRAGSEVLKLRDENPGKHLNELKETINQNEHKDQQACEQREAESVERSHDEMQKLKKLIRRQEQEIKQLKQSLVQQRSEQNELAKIFVSCVEQVRKERNKRKLREMYTKRSGHKGSVVDRSFVQDSEQDLEKIETLCKVNTTTSAAVASAELSAAEKELILNLFLNDTVALHKLSQHLFPAAGRSTMELQRSKERAPLLRLRVLDERMDNSILHVCHNASMLPTSRLRLKEHESYHIFDHGPVYPQSVLDPNQEVIQSRECTTVSCALANFVVGATDRSPHTETESRLQERPDADCSRARNFCST